MQHASNRDALLCTYIYIRIKSTFCHLACCVRLFVVLIMILCSFRARVYLNVNRSIFPLMTRQAETKVFDPARGWRIDDGRAVQYQDENVGHTHKSRCFAVEHLSIFRAHEYFVDELLSFFFFSVQPLERFTLFSVSLSGLPVQSKR